MDTLQGDAKELSREAGKALFDNDEWDKAAERAGKRVGKVFGEEMGKGGSKASEILDKALVDGSEETGQKAAKKYQGAFRTELKRGIAETQRELKALKIDVDVDDADAKAEIKALMAELKAIGKAKIGVDLDAATAVARIAAVEKALNGLRDDASINLDFDLGAAEAGVAKFRKKLESLNDAANIVVEADTKIAERQLGAFEKRVKEGLRKATESFGDGASRQLGGIRAEMAAMGDLKIDADLDATKVLGEMAAIEAALRAVADDDSYEIDVRVDADEAAKELAGVAALAAGVAANDVDIDVDVDSGAATAQLAATGAAAKAAGGDAGNAANAFRTFNAVVLAAVTLGPALIPVLGAMAGGLAALGPAAIGAAGGLAVLMIGFSGIGNGVKAVLDKNKNAAKDSLAASKTMGNAAQAVADAQKRVTRANEDAAESAADSARAVSRAKADAARANRDAQRDIADARKSAAEAVANAIRQEQAAQEDYTRAQRDAAEAQADLVQARKDAIDEIDALNDRVRDGALTERQAIVDLFEATVAYNAAMSDGASTNLDREQASIALERAKNALSDIREENAKAGDEKARIDKEGVDGTKTVQNAQERLVAAVEAQTRAQEALREASAQTDQTRLDGVRKVADAIDRANRTQAAGAQAVRDAERAQGRAAQDSADAISAAQLGLQRAQEDYQAALKTTGDVGSASMQAYNEAMNALGPAGQRFVLFLAGLRDKFYEIRDAIQNGLLPGVQNMIETVMSKYGPSIKTFATVMGTALGNAFRQVGKVLTGPAMTQFFATFAQFAPMFIRVFTKTALNWLEIFANLMVAAAPLSEKLGRGLLKISDGILKWTKSKSGQDTMTKFFDWVADIAPTVVDFFKNLAGALINLGIALAPIGETVLKGITGFLGFIANMDPTLLAIIVEGVLGLVFAVQAASLAISIISGAALLFGSTIGIVVLVIAGLVAAFIIAYTHSERFRDIVNGVLKAVGKVVVWLWNHILKPFFDYTVWIWGEVGRAFSWVWKNVLKPIFGAFGDVIKFLWDHVIKPVFGFIKVAWDALATAFRWAWKNFIWPVIDLFGHVITKLWDTFVKPALHKIRTGWEAIQTAFEVVWAAISPIINSIATAIGTRLTSVFDKAVGFITRVWGTLQDTLAAPVRFVIETVLNNGLIAGFNKIAKFVGSDPMGKIPVPDFAKAKPKYDPPKMPSNAGGSHGGALNVGAATGGVLPGYTPGRDVHHYVSPTGGRLHLSGGEGILRPEVTREVEPWLHAMNRAARVGGTAGVRKALMGRQSHFAKGGVFWPVPGHLTGTYPGHDGVDINRGSGWDDLGDPIRAFRSGRIVYVGSGRGYGQAIFEQPDAGPLVVYGHTSKTYVRSGQRVAGGQLIGSVGNSGHSTAPHLHFGTPGGTTAGALALLAGAIDVAASTSGGGGFHLPGWLTKIAGGPLGWAKGLVEKGMGKVVDKFGDNGFVKILGGVAKKLLGGMVEKVKSLLAGVDDEATGAIAGGNAQKIVQRMAAERGWVGAQWDALSTIIDRESSWNPNAANANSSARGLFQKMTSLHGPIEDTVAGQATWGLQYIKSKYGDPLKALAYWNANGSYADGGIVGEAPGGVADNGTMMYDNGGYLPPGLTTVLNLTGKPEPVLLPGELDAMRSGGGGGFTYAPTFNASDLTSTDVAQDLEFTMRKHGKLGKYGKRD